MKYKIKGQYGETWHLDSGCKCDGTHWPSPVVEVRCKWNDIKNGYELRPTCKHGNEPPFTDVNDWFNYPKTLPKLSDFYREFGDSIKKVVEVN